MPSRNPGSVYREYPILSFITTVTITFFVAVCREYSAVKSEVDILKNEQESLRSQRDVSAAAVVVVVLDLHLRSSTLIQLNLEVVSLPHE